MSQEPNKIDPWANAGFEDVAPEGQPKKADPWAGFEDTAPTKVPPAAAERMAAGAALQAGASKGYWETTGDVFGEAWAGMKNGLTNARALDPEVIKSMKEMGATDASIAKASESAQRGQLLAGVAGGAFGMVTSPIFGAIRHWGTEPLEAATGVPKEVSETGLNIALAVVGLGLVKTGPGTLGRVIEGPEGKPIVQPLGPPPTASDFQVSAATTANAIKETTGVSPDVNIVKENLRHAWEDHGLHPAEVSEIAQGSLFAAHDLSSAALVPENLPPVAPLAQAPTPPVGKITAAARNIQQNLSAIYDSAQMSTSPINRAIPEAQNLVVDLGNTLRWNRWNWNNLDTDLAKNWKPEQRSMMWERLDEESMAVQYGDSQLAFHGTPHFFDKFAINNIGTGEGAQVFGHGLYFAESPGTAKAYQANLSKMNQHAIDLLQDHNFDSAKAMTAYETKLSKIQKVVEDNKADKEFKLPEKDQTFLDNAAQIKKEIKENVGGHFYTVKIDIPKEQFLDWDKPVAEQPRLVAIIDKMVEQGKLDADSAEQFKAGAGEGIMRKLGQDLTPAGASKLLLENDIKGVRYLDQGSRAKGVGTHNIVTFDDKAVQIIHTDGKPLTEAQIKQLHMEQEAKGEPAYGLSALSPEEHSKVSDLHARSAHAWVSAIDQGIVKGLGIPFYAPRMIVNAMGSVFNGRGSVSLNAKPIVKTSTQNLKMRKYMEAGDTEEAAKAKVGEEAYLAHDIRALPLATAMLEDAVAGRRFINEIKDLNEDYVAHGFKPSNDYFTVPEHPGFYDYVFSDGKMQAKPIYIHKDMEGAVRAIMRVPNPAWVNAVMDLKSRAMGAIMGTFPIIHHAVVLSKVFEAAPGEVGKSFFTPMGMGIYAKGTRALNNLPLVEEAIRHNGLVPIGRWFQKQDINSVMAEPEFVQGKTWTNKLVSAIPGLFDEKAEKFVSEKLQAYHDYRQNNLLWDQVQRMQFGVYDHLRSKYINAGMDAKTAGITSAHFSNLVVGALPQEIMSQSATTMANGLLFSRSYTLSNWGLLKSLIGGLPERLKSQIQHDVGALTPEQLAKVTEAGQQLAVKRAAGMATRMAIGIGVTSVIAYHTTQNLFQVALNLVAGRTDIDQEMRGYARRTGEAIQARTEDPLKWLQMLDMMQTIGATGDNEPGKKDRIRFGTTSDGTAKYIRNPFGKFAEELMDMTSVPSALSLTRRKLSPDASFILDLVSNDKGFGRVVYDPSAEDIKGQTESVMHIASHFIGKHLPTQAISPLMDMAKGHGEPSYNAMQALLPTVGLQVSSGAPGGPQMGAARKAKQTHDYQMQLQMPDVYRDIQDGKDESARSRMDKLGLSPKLQEWYLRTVKDPSTRFRSKTLRDLEGYMNERQQQEFERLRETK